MLPFFCIFHVMSLMSHVFAEQKKARCESFVFPLVVLDFKCASAEYADRSLRLLVP